jgi:hypothetical protein
MSSNKVISCTYTPAEGFKFDVTTRPENKDRIGGVVQTIEHVVVKKIEFEGKKYLKAKYSNVVYDYKKYTVDGEEIIIGEWDDSINGIKFY